MQGAAVGLYCAVVDLYDLLVSTRTIAAPESQAVFNQGAESVRAWLRALNLGLVVRRQSESKNGAARLMRVRPQSSSMGFDD
jgi:hypothetical protein